MRVPGRKQPDEEDTGDYAVADSDAERRLEREVPWPHRRSGHRSDTKTIPAGIGSTKRMRDIKVTCRPCAADRAPLSNQRVTTRCCAAITRAPYSTLEKSPTMISGSVELTRIRRQGAPGDHQDGVHPAVAERAGPADRHIADRPAFRQRAAQFGEALVARDDCVLRHRAHPLRRFGHDLGKPRKQHEQEYQRKPGCEADFQISRGSSDVLQRSVKMLSHRVQVDVNQIGGCE